MTLMAHSRRSRDQVEVVLTLEPLLNDLHVQQPEEPAPEAESQRHRTFRLEEERRIIESQFFQRLAQLRVLMSVDCIKSREHHRLDLFKSRQRLNRRSLLIGDGVTNFRVGDVLDIRHQKTDFARSQFIYLDRLGRERAQSFHLKY